MPGPLTCLRLLSGGLVLSPVPPSSGKMGTHYLFSSRSGERESSFLGPVRDCSALQTTSLRPMSVSRGSKPCRGWAEKIRPAGGGVLLLPSQLCPFGSLEQGRLARLPGLLDTRITSIPSPSSLWRAHCCLPTPSCATPIFCPRQLRWPGLGAHPSPWSLTSKGLEKSGSWPPSSPARVQRRMTARHSSSTATGHSAISWE